MSVLENALYDLHRLEDLAAGETFIHRLHPGANFLATAVFVTVVASFPRYEVTGLMPLVVYPAFTLLLADLPLGFVLARLLVVSPFVLFFALADLFFIRAPLVRFGPFFLPAGWISAASLLLRFFLSVSAALSFVATGGFVPFCAFLARWRLFRPFASVLFFVYRYSYLTLEEAARLVRAHNLRAGGRGLRLREWGHLIGPFLWRTYARAHCLYLAMVARGFNGVFPSFGPPRKWTGKDLLYVSTWTIFFLLARCVDLAALLGGLVLGGTR
ncbi:MAG: cobalt ECF transporter T component CbiQ [Firmicutes bacterium]|nr:cobalt ECF transporter T component CbiQ [Bacillota bacterium]